MPNHSITYIKQKRAKLYTELKSNAQCVQAAAMSYGEHNPLKVSLVPCEQCNNSIDDVLMTVTSNETWDVQCADCGRVTKASRPKRWQAALEWRAINLGCMHYSELPLFHLSDLDAAQAHNLLTDIRRNLELRTNIIGLDNEIAKRENKRQPNQKRHQIIKAYLQWCLYGLRLTKIALAEHNNALQNASLLDQMNNKK